MMKRNDVLRWLNPAMAVLVVNQALTGYLAVRLPRGVFEVLHEGGGTVLVLASLLHVILNWNWIRTTYRGKGSVPGA
jgi:heme A synthase